ncbi:MAG: hypothetical protein A2W85_07530 [Bacteroidetes bacterium GWF2_41_31]|nr:MAG: hypothetical protein A2W85_07530 [Bacteroidetes bacterium GWF2_41_31]OFZ08409.1 MAG: hypothetical protein A2338_09490 [Bacteroidetes bacterium RIFOXYB12_FULL_41_6]
MNSNITNSLLLATLASFIVNIPFGYLRAGQKKFSFRWFLYIHLPVPLVIFIRFLFELGFEFITYPFLVTSFFLGQALGAVTRWYFDKKK